MKSQYDRLLLVQSPEGQFLPDAALLLAGTMQYPDCTTSIGHYKYIIGSDEDISEGYKSKIGRLIQTDALSRKRQGHVVGHVALRVLEASVQGIMLSQNKAVYLVTELAKTWDNEDGTEFAPRSTSAIRKALKNFNDVIHFWAAQVACTELFVAAGQSNEDLAKFLSVAAVFEEALEKTWIAKQWNPWRVPNDFRGELRVKVPSFDKEVAQLLKKYHPSQR